MMKIDTAYDELTATEYDEMRFATAGGQSIHSVELKLLREGLSCVTVKEPRTLEVGCGTGRLLASLVGDGCIATGLDPSPHMLGEAQKKVVGSDLCELVRGEAGSLPFDDDAFDFVYSIRVLNQTGSKEYACQAIKEMLRVVEPGGYVLVEFMNSRRRALATKKVHLGDREVDRVNSADVRLLPSEVCKLTASEAHVVWERGAFVFGMTAFYKVPGILLGALSLADRISSRVLSRWGSRCYMLLRKKVEFK